MATPPKKPTGTPTPPRRKAAARKPAATPKAPAVEPPAAPAPATGETKAKATKPTARRASGRAKAAPATKPRKREAASSQAPRTRAATTAAAVKAVTQSPPVRLVAETREKVGDPTFFGAIIGGLLAVGAAVAGVFLTRKRPTTAHQADGADSSASFAAGIADEGTLPDKAV